MSLVSARSVKALVWSQKLTQERAFSPTFGVQRCTCHRSCRPEGLGLGSLCSKKVRNVLALQPLPQALFPLPGPPHSGPNGTARASTGGGQLQRTSMH